jgi:hypothetical protein
MKELKDIKCGDKVIYSRLFQPDKILEVTKVTKTLIICGVTRFNKTTGAVTGANSWDKATIHYPEDGEIEAIKKQTLIHAVARKLHTLDPLDITYEQAVKIKEIFNW